MPERTRTKDEVVEAADHGLTFSGQAYQVRNLGEIHVAADRARDSFASNEEYIRYIYENRNDTDKVRFVNAEENNLYKATRYQDRIAGEIARQEGVEVSAPPASFREEAQRAQRPVEIEWGTPEITAVETPREQPRTETVSVDAHYAGRPVHFEINVAGMSDSEREFLQGRITDVRNANAGNIDYILSTFIDNFKGNITNLAMEAMNTETRERYWVAVPLEGSGADIVAQIGRLARGA